MMATGTPSAAPQRAASAGASSHLSANVNTTQIRCAPCNAASTSRIRSGASVARITTATTAAGAIRARASRVAALSPRRRTPGVSTTRIAAPSSAASRQATVDPATLLSSPTAWPVRPRNSADLPAFSRPASTTTASVDSMASGRIASTRRRQHSQASSQQSALPNGPQAPAARSASSGGRPRCCATMRATLSKRWRNL